MEKGQLLLTDGKNSESEKEDKIYTTGFVITAGIVLLIIIVVVGGVFIQGSHEKPKIPKTNAENSSSPAQSQNPPQQPQGSAPLIAPHLPANDTTEGGLTPTPPPTDVPTITPTSDPTSTPTPTPGVTPTSTPMNTPTPILTPTTSITLSPDQP